jgi:hypothetical protein
MPRFLGVVGGTSVVEGGMIASESVLVAIGID